MAGRFSLLLAVCLLSVPGATQAADSSLAFLRAARERGYGRVSVEYLKMLEASGRLPSDLKETFDLEMSRSLRVAATNDAFNKEERERWLAESRSRLEKFVKEHSKHPDVAGAQSSFGEFAMDAGSLQLKMYRAAQDKDAKGTYLTEARKSFKEAQKRFADAAKRYDSKLSSLRKQLDNLKDEKGVSATRLRRAEQQLEDTAFEAARNRLNVGQAEFGLAQTYEDPEEKGRKSALSKAAKNFDAIYQDHRDELIGLTAHAWHGRAADEAGQHELASDIYEEVLANAPEGAALSRPSALDGLFSQVFYFKALLAMKTDKADEFIETAPDWLKAYRVWRTSDGYQGILFEYAKALLAKADKAEGNEKTKLAGEAMRHLREMRPIASEHQGDAILLLMSLSKNADATEIKSPAEAVVLGEDALRSGEFDAAERFYEQALDLLKASTKAEDVKLAANVREAIDQVRYRKAIQLYGEQKFEEVIDICSAIASNHASTVGPPASALAVQATLMLYVRAADAEAKQAALDRLTKVATYTTETWPDKPEADDARIAMGQSKLVQGNFEEAIQAFEAVNARSERYGNALYLAGQTHWRIYSTQEKQDAEKGAQRAAFAIEKLGKAVEALREQRARRPKDPPPDQLADAELLLAEVLIDTGESARAVELVAPLVDGLVKAKPAAVDKVMLRTFLAAVRAHLALNQLEEASQTAQALAELAADEAQANRILVGFASMFHQNWKTAKAGALEARNDEDRGRQTTAEEQQKRAGAILAEFIAKLSPRTLIDVKGLLFLAKAGMEVDRPDLSEPIYRSLLEKADAGDPSVPQQAIPLVRSELIGIVRRDGNFAEALKQVDKLLESNPNVLSFMMERGRILQSWAEKDPAKYNDAVQQWVSIRTKLQSLPKKPPEFYEVNYNAALCLYEESLKTKDASKAKDAAKLLNALLFMNPKLDGPDTVAQYKDLLKRIDPEGFKKQHQSPLSQVPAHR